MIEHIEETTSTNDDALAPRYRHGDIIWAERQTRGRGQRGHTWSSTEGKNLTFSLVLEPHFLPVGEQFLLSEVIALSLIDTFSEFGIDTRIKWTNDIYAGDRKLVGILIEHHYSASRLSRTIVGIGINVNQEEFSAELPNPVSMIQLVGHATPREEVLAAFQSAFEKRYAQLENGDKALLQEEYRQKMYRLGEIHAFELPDGSRLRAEILGVKPSGELILRHADNTLHEYLFREINFVLKE